MKLKYRKDLPSGVRLLCIFYIINAFLFLVTSLIFSEYIDVIIIGKIIEDMSALLTKFILILFPLYLALGLSLLRKDTWVLTIIYHLFFIINGALMILYLKKTGAQLRPLLEITLKPEYKPGQTLDLLHTPSQPYLLQILAAIIGVFIIIYLFSKRNLFKV